MASTWNKVISGMALVAVLSSQIGIASACPNRRKPAPRAAVPVTAAPVVAQPVVVAPVAVAPAVVEKTAPAPVVRPAAAETATDTKADLELFDIRLVDSGNDVQGPSYRVIVKNLTGTAVTAEITVALLASMEKDSDDNLSVIGSLESLGAGEKKSIDLRLPKGAEALTYLTAAVASADGNDANETDNIAVYERNTVLAAR